MDHLECVNFQIIEVSWVFYFVHVYAAAAKSLQSCLTLCDPIDGNPPGSPVPGILQARTLEWVAISFSNAWRWKVKVKSLSRIWLFGTPWTAAHQAPPSMGFSRQECWSGVPSPSPIYIHTQTFIYFWPCWVCVATQAFLWLREAGALLFVVGALLLFWALGCASFSSCSMWAQAWLFSGSGAQAQQLWGTALIAPWHCGILPDQGLNPCLLHWQVDSLPLSQQGSLIFYYYWF